MEKGRTTMLDEPKVVFRKLQKKLQLTDEETAETLGVQLFVVQQWGMGIWIMPRMAEKFLRTLIELQRYKQKPEYVKRGKRYVYRSRI